MSEEEEKHLQSSSDGLKYFIPLDIHSSNITAISGLVEVLKFLSKEGFGSPTHRRVGKYSLLHVDVKIYWQLFRMLYSYPMLAPIRHDLFLVFGLWHPYHYAHIAAWRQYRSTFLGPAYFLLYPHHNLKERPLLTHSATFFLWLRLSYPGFQAKLVDATTSVKQNLLNWALDNA